MASVFDRQSNVSPSQMRAVADRRFDDAQALGATRLNKHANGVMYLAGLVIEILLKAQLAARYPTISRTRGRALTTDEQWIRSLIYRSHELGAMLDRLPELEAAVIAAGVRDGVAYVDQLKGLCATWSIAVRYSTRSSTMAEADDMLEQVRRLKELLK